jgi:hypothetical protein
MLTVILILKTLAEIAGLALLGQGVLYVLAGANREQNFFYRILKTMTTPVWVATRFIAPRVIVDRHIGFLAFLLVALGWYFLLVWQAAQCLTDMKHPVCEPLLVRYVERCEAGQADACDVLARNGLAPPARGTHPAPPAP